MRWPRRRKPDELGALLDAVKVPRTVTTGRPAAHENADKLRAELDADTPLHDLAAACHDAGLELQIETTARRPWDAVPLHELIGPVLADATQTIPNPHAKETPVTTPAFEPYDELDQDAHDYLVHPGAQRQTAWQLVQRLNADRLDARRVANLMRDVRDAEAPGYTTQIDGVKIAKCDTRGQTSGERAAYQRGLREGRLDNTVVRAEVVGSSEWLRDLADRLQQYGELIGMVDPEEFTTTPRAIRSYADKTERQAAADTRDRDRVEKIVLRQLEERAVAAINTVTDAIGVDRVLDAHFDTYTAWATLTDEQKAEALAPALELYRAGRDDQEADRG